MASPRPPRVPASPCLPVPLPSPCLPVPLSPCPVLTSAVFAIALALLSGCAHYEYDLVRPADLAQHIGADYDVIVRLPPLEYRLRTVDDYLVMRIFNSTNDRIRLLGEQSVAVDPQGQSHPLRSRMIAPRSFIKLILPPPPPQVGPVGPSFGFGFGFGPRWGYGVGLYDPLYDPYWGYPRYYAPPDAAAPYYWTWSDQGDARLELTFQSGGQKPFAQRFLFHRRRM